MLAPAGSHIAAKVGPAARNLMPFKSSGSRIQWPFAVMPPANQAFDSTMTPFFSISAGPLAAAMSHERRGSFAPNSCRAVAKGGHVRIIPESDIPSRVGPGSGRAQVQFLFARLRSVPVRRSGPLTNTRRQCLDDAQSDRRATIKRAAPSSVVRGTLFTA